MIIAKVIISVNAEFRKVIREATFFKPFFFFGNDDFDDKYEQNMCR